MGGHRVETAGLSLSVRAVVQLAQVQEPGCACGEARGRRGLDKMTEKRSTEAKKTWQLVELPDAGGPTRASCHRRRHSRRTAAQHVTYSDPFDGGTYRRMQDGWQTG